MARRAGARKVDYAPVARIRSATVCELDYGEETAWVYERVLHLAAAANRRLWRVDLSGIFHPLKLIRYGKGDHYDWHTDLGAGIVSDRKLSVTVQLSAASDYAGGNLELLVQPHPLAVPRQLGCAIVFPSYALHRVTPVSMGSRLALVGWIQGPPYR
ncbi:MAG: 2OG-Fe(II) oxygenase [Deltaproteobacteria bacterium]